MTEFDIEDLEKELYTSIKRKNGKSWRDSKQSLNKTYMCFLTKEEIVFLLERISSEDISLDGS